MKNNELLLMGGGKPYPDATHWITVGKAVSGDYTYYGYVNPAAGGNNPASSAVYCGSLEPDSIGGIYPTDLASSLYKGSPMSGAYTQCNFLSQKVTIDPLKITRLDNGAVVVFTYNGKTMSTPKSEYATVALFTSTDVGLTIPLKIEPE